MPQCTPSDFDFDNQIMQLIAKSIRDAQNLKVEDLADLLTDRKIPASFTEVELEWMKKTPVKNITMGKSYTKNTGTFFDLLEAGEPMLSISARSTGNGEFRGNIVQSVIRDAQSTNPELTVYDSFQAHIR